jgi:outer membrane protein insertion porin family
MRNDYYWPLGKDIVWYFSFRVGYEQTVNLVTSSGTPSIIPLIKEFALGGINSIRGYAEQSINNPNQLVGGSLAYVNYRTQMDMPFSGALKFGLFADAGNLLVNNFSFGGLNYGVGFGFHYQTPVGPINFDWGFPIDPPATADPFVIHFSVGVI